MKCFLVAPTDTALVYLRRYSSVTKCVNDSYHNAMFLIQESPLVWEGSGDRRCYSVEHLGVPFDDSRWPSKCERCDYVFSPEDEHQEFIDRIYADQADLSRRFGHRSLPSGAMYFEDWLPLNMYWDNKSDRHLMVVLPNGSEWNVDSRCNNCTLPNDRTHRCWQRTGEPPNVTAGKGPGPTCSAGGGSIQSAGWHGFLRNGELVLA